MRLERLAKVALLALALTNVGSCTNDLENPSFDLSCSGGACGWEVEQGSTRQVPTWNEHDKGLELRGTPAIISQRVDGSLDCDLEVEVFGDVARGAELTVALDSDDDGTVDDSFLVSPLDWESELFTLSGPSGSAWRLRIEKRGSGEVVLAHVFAGQRCD